MNASLTRLRERAEALAQRAPKPDDFTSGLRDPGVTSRIGVWLGVCFGVAFLTGFISHEAHLAHPFIAAPTRPVWGYRLSQGLHVAAGTAAIPLLLVKLWTVYPQLFARPPRRLRALALHGLERISIAVLVAAAIFQLATGLANAAQWYPWDFHFRATHYALGWIAIGALLVHIAVKLPVIREALGSPLVEPPVEPPAVEAGTPAVEAGSPVVEAGPPVVERSRDPLTRRGLVRTALGASGLAVLATVGSTLTPLRKISVLGVRNGGPAGIPINKSAKAADVVATALDPAYRLVVSVDGRETTFSRDDLLALPQRRATLPIACVEGWSASGTWTGVRVRDLVAAAGGTGGRDLRFVSLQQHGPYKATVLPHQFADDPLTLLAVDLEGQPLSIDHGYPCRLIAPNRPGVLQTKWVARIEVLHA